MSEREEKAGRDRDADREGDPRGGLQSDDYRSADPRELVEEDGTVMAGPGGTPQEGLSVEERRELGDERRRDRDEDGPAPGH